MAFEVDYKTTGEIAKLALGGELDAASAATFKAAVERAAEEGARRLVLLMDRLEYMSSAGLRVLIFAQQTMGRGKDIFMIGARESIRETIRMTGFHQCVTMLDAYDPERVENL